MHGRRGISGSFQHYFSRAMIMDGWLSAMNCSIGQAVIEPWTL